MPIDDTTQILGQADALIRRHRVFVAASQADANATPAEGMATASTDAGLDTEPELPLLTEIVTLDELASPSLEAQCAHAIQEEITRWLDEELPGAVLKVTDGLADQLVQKITHQAGNALLPRVLAHLNNQSNQTEKTGSKR
ncbi:MAG: hypothetical protein HZB64_09935 [Rhodocyclales bacterium]|nr:hypothetical protein [Rhodocyclales bacterium]